jgi:hypothetical protein
MELLTIDLAEISGHDLRESGKKISESRRSAKRRVDLSRKPGFGIDGREGIDPRFGIPLAICTR